VTTAIFYSKSASPVNLFFFFPAALLRMHLPNSTTPKAIPDSTSPALSPFHRKDEFTRAIRAHSVVVNRLAHPELRSNVFLKKLKLNWLLRFQRQECLSKSPEVLL
jgi:hypothetical protein